MYNIDRNIKNKSLSIKLLGKIMKYKEIYFTEWKMLEQGKFTLLTGNIKDYKSLIIILTRLQLLKATLISVIINKKIN